MKIETAEVTLRKITAGEGYVFKQANGEDVYGGVIYLSVADSPENYIEITKEEAEALIEKQKGSGLPV